MFSASLVVDAKQRCLPELHDVPYDTPPPSNATAVNPSSSSSSPSAAAMAAGSSAGVRNSSRHHHDDLMDEPIYANAAAHPPLVGNSLCLYVTGGVSRIHSVFMLHIHKCASICACDIVSMMCSERLDAFFFPQNLSPDEDKFVMFSAEKCCMHWQAELDAVSQV